MIPPTCTEHGYTVYTCPDCGNEYIGDLTECEQHKYTEMVIAPTCTEMGYTIFTCETCGDTYKSEYTEAAGHKPSDWIIDVPATIENAGSKHIECERCGEVLQTVELAQLIDKDNSFTVLLPAESLIDYANRITVWFFVYAISLVTFPEARQCPHGRRCLWN